jgi:hypothetical protein
MSQTLAQLIQGLSVNASAPVGSLTVDSLGRVLVGTSTARSNFFGTTLSAGAQVEGTGGATGRGAVSVINNDVSNNPPYVLLGRSGAASLGSNAVVVSGSRLGTLTFHGADGTSFIEAATVAGEVDGTPGTNDMPGRLVFSTTSDGAASPTERFRISSDGSFSSVIPGGSTLYPRFGCRAWVNFNGTGTVAIRGSGNVSSITDNGVGDYTVNFTTAMPDANYSVSGAVQSEAGTAVDRFFTLRGDISMTSSGYRFRVINGVNTAIDCPTVTQSIFR